MDPLKKRVRKDLRRCEEALYSAETLLEENLYQESISRAYYGVIHAAMLYLAESGTNTRRPDEAEELFNKSFIQTASLDSELYSLFVSVRRTKIESERNFLVRYSAEEAREAFQKARDFLDRTHRHFGAGA
jgi:uncharacterized protein (UPF0332 family)